MTNTKKAPEVRFHGFGDLVAIHHADGTVTDLDLLGTKEAHDLTPTCRAARDAHWTAHSLACRSRRDLVIVQRKAAR
jgi:hypothetical protein